MVFLKYLLLLLLLSCSTLTFGLEKNQSASSDAHELKWMDLPLMKNNILRCRSRLLLLNCIEFLILRLLKELSPRSLDSLCEVVLSLCKSIVRYCMKYCCHVWAVARSC